MSKLINDINEIVNWWYKLPPDYTALNDIDFKLQRLSGLYYAYTTEVANAYGKHLSSYVARRIMVARHELGLYDKMSQSKAEKQAIAENETHYIDEIVKEAEYSEHRLRLSAMSKVMDAMRSRITTLRDERHRTAAQ